MAQTLSESKIRQITEPGKYMDGHGLFLRVTKAGTKQWVQRITIDGNRRDIGLGGWPDVKIAAARHKVWENRRLVKAGGNPIAESRKATIPTFAQAAEATIKVHEPTWKDGSRTAAIWRSSLARHAKRLAGLRVDRITTADVMNVLLPIWTDKPDMSRKIKQRISTVMKWAIAEGHRADNPAGDAIGAALPSNNGKAQNFRALPHGSVAAALCTVRATDAAPATKLAFEFLVLTAARSGEVRGARWDEIDMDAALWTVPADRMKMGRSHRVPLSGRALAVLREAAPHRDTSGLVFPSVRGGTMSDNTLSKLLRENGVAAVPHGFRSSFRDWCADTGTPRDIAEAALAHTVAGVEGAYLRSDLLERRRPLVERWAEYLNE